MAGSLTLDYAAAQNGTADITVRATDAGGLWVESTFTVTVNPVNDAPVFDNSGGMTLTNVAENATSPAGDTVADIIASAGGDRITDVDAGAVEGIAVTGVNDTNGTWQYKVGAGAWTAFGTVSETAAVVLDVAALVRFVPNAGYSGSAGNLTFRAWDTTDGNPSGTTSVNVSINGGTTAYSTDVEAATLSVVADSGQSLWISAEQDVPSPSGWNDLATEGINASEILALGGPNLALEPGTGTTDGTFSRMVDFDPMVIAGQSRVDALHHVGRDITVGTNAVNLSKGDVLFSFFEGGTITLQNSDLTTLDVQRNDIVCFHPDAPGNYTAGTFSILLDGSDLGFNSLSGFTLVEQSTTVGQGAGATTLDAGDILFVDWNGVAADAHIQRLQPGTLGDTTTATISILVDGNDLSSDFSLPNIVGLDLVEEDTAIGGTLLRSGQILLTLPGTDDVGGVTAGEHDIVALDVTTTGTDSVATAKLLFVGNDVGLSDWQEDIRGLSLSAGVDEAPTQVNNAGLVVAEGGTVTITNTELRFDDDVQPATSVSYTITTGPAHGQLELTTDPGNAVTSFTQDDIDNNRVVYVHDGSNTISDTFNFSVDDGQGNSLAGQTFSITVTPVDNDAPVVVNNTGSIAIEGGSDTLITAELLFTDSEQPATSVTYTVTGGLANGQLELTTGPGVAVTSFTQDDIDNNRVVYVHDGSNTISDTFNFSVDDGQGNTLAGQSFSIIVTAVDDDAPFQLINTGSTVNEGGTDTISNTELRYADSEQPVASLTYTVTVVPSNGQMESPPIQATQLQVLRNPRLMPVGSFMSMTVAIRRPTVSHLVSMMARVTLSLARPLI